MTDESKEAHSKTNSLYSGNMNNTTNPLRALTSYPKLSRGQAAKPILVSPTHITAVVILTLFLVRDTRFKYPSGLYADAASPSQVTSSTLFTITHLQDFRVLHYGSSPDFPTCGQCNAVPWSTRSRSSMINMEK